MAIKPSHGYKLVTCCYCSARSTLPRKADKRLVCHGCGAPITRIEELQPSLERQRKSHTHAKPSTPHPAEIKGEHLEKDRPSRRRKGKRKDWDRSKRKKRKPRSIWHHISEAFDDLDDVFDIFD